ncbi:copper resistance CopC family protein [Micromonospora endolithica]|uniref:Copper resistance protein CopC n=1 Tax=Micromonospora endolithica TaxID=230091 RepID=A0A3A9ZHB8_9ACTN|nr:copper resistance CopC family protein [Micromonospora endolithica]RKN47738.1 copper resistance protein CopC [Micromonospora endolithica]TWJ21413.1 hypothetical protein JD76_01523 [Micromonospora endolithica]
MPTRTRPSVAGLLAATLTAMALLLVPAAPAAAHNTLQAATPARDARLTAAPTMVTLRFMQKLDPAFTTIAVSDAAQRRIPTGEPAVKGTTGTVTIDEPLSNGTYTVAYRVVSTDGHPVQGSYRFTVADPTVTASPEVTAPVTSAAPATSAAPGSPSPASSTGATEGPGPLVLVGGGVLLVAVMVAGIVLLLRRRRSS